MSYFYLWKQANMLEKLTVAAERRATSAVTQTINRIAIKPTPPGIAAEPTDGGVILSGKGLRRRMLSNPNLRNFTR